MTCLSRDAGPGAAGKEAMAVGFLNVPPLFLTRGRYPGTYNFRIFADLSSLASSSFTKLTVSDTHCRAQKVLVLHYFFRLAHQQAKRRGRHAGDTFIMNSFRKI